VRYYWLAVTILQYEQLMSNRAKARTSFFIRAFVHVAQTKLIRASLEEVAHRRCAGRRSGRCNPRTQSLHDRLQ
jgi:hypothetical protein